MTSLGTVIGLLKNAAVTARFDRDLLSEYLALIWEDEHCKTREGGGIINRRSGME